MSDFSVVKILGTPTINLTPATASQVNIVDIGGYYVGTEMETALAEIGAGTTLDSRYVNISGDTMTGLLQFSGTAHAGVKLLSLTTTQRDALTPANGMIIYNSTDNQVQGYVDSAWGQIGGGGSQTPWTSDVNAAGYKLIGNTTTTGDLSLQTTSGVGATGADMHFLVGNNGATEAMTILNSGFVGIGTTGPGRALDINGSAAEDGIKITASTYPEVLLYKGATWYSVFGVSGSAGGYYTGTLANATVLGGKSGSALQLGAGGVLSTTIDTSGNVGIGTTGPTDKLSVVAGGSGIQSGMSVTTYNSNTALPSYLEFDKSHSNTVGSLVTTVDQESLGTFNAGGVNTSNAIARGARIRFIQDGTAGVSWVPAMISFQTSDGTADAADRLTIKASGNVGIGTTSPTNLLSLGGNSARIFWLERHTTANTAGNTLTIIAGGATSGATDKAGGALILQGGLSTGSAESGVTIHGCVAGASGTADRTQTTAIQVLGNKIGFYAVTPVVRPTALTTQLTTITHTAPGTPDYAIQNFTQTTPFGFVTADEANTVLSVIANLQTRVSELETKLQALGLLT